MQEPEALRVHYPIPPRGWHRFNPVDVWLYLRHVEQFFATLRGMHISLRGEPAARVILSAERQMAEGYFDYKATHEMAKRRAQALRRHTTEDVSLFL